MWPDLQLETNTKKLQTYSGKALTLIGKAEVDIKYGGQQVNLPLLVVAGEGRSHFGQDWLSSMTLNWRDIHQVQESTLESVLNRSTEVIQGGLRNGPVSVKPDLFLIPCKCKLRNGLSVHGKTTH